MTPASRQVSIVPWLLKSTDQFPEYNFDFTQMRHLQVAHQEH